MIQRELREKFLDFFIEKEHKKLPSSSLIDVTDSSVLLTTAGMQQFKDYFSGRRNIKKEIGSEKITTIQKCFRTSDIEEVGDKDHLTFLEMLGNFSFNGTYFKKEAITYAVEFLESLGFKKNDFKVTVFEGDKKVPFDKQSYKIWIDLGIKEGQIEKCGKEDNFWGPTGDEGPCGPTTEIYLGGSEVWNIVFNQYYKDKKGNLVPLEKKGIDTGMGLERLAMAISKKSSVFETDFFVPLINEIRNVGKYEQNETTQKEERIIADHIRGAVFLISEELSPSNLKEGYILRRVLRRAIRSAMKLELKEGWYINLVKVIIEEYGDFWQDIKKNEQNFLSTIEKENNNFKKVLTRGEKELEKLILKQGDVKTFSGENAFMLYESCGFPPELTKELLKERGLELDKKGFKDAKIKHQNISKTFHEKKEGGIRANPDYYEIKLHTATHLLHKALRDILGKKVKQMGSDISEKRLRFDFSFDRALTEEEIVGIEKTINQKIAQDLQIDKEEMTYKQAIEMGCLGFFKEKYPKNVSVYKIHSKESKTDFFSCEICKGPHINLTSELKRFKIIKQESVGAGVRRIKAKVER